jgi:hypothetical protein
MGSSISGFGVVNMLDVYRQVACRIGTQDALALAQELRAWHDAMVSHQRTLARLGSPPQTCADWDECAHGLARELWKQATVVLGEHADELTFLRDCATAADAAGA